MARDDAPPTSLLDDPKDENPDPKPRRRRERAQNRPGRRNIPGLEAELAKAHLSISVIAVGASNPGVLAHRPAMDLLEEQSHAWAAALVGVCQQDERVMNVVLATMHAGAWVAFAGATAGSLVTIGALSGRVQVPYGAAMLVAPKLLTVLPSAATNEKEPGGAREAADQ